MSVRLFGKLAVILFFTTFVVIVAPSCNSKASKTDDEQSDTDFITIDSDAS